MSGQDTPLGGKRCPIDRSPEDLTDGRAAPRPVGVPASCLVAGSVTGAHAWVLTALDVTSWPDPALVLLVAAPMLLALAGRTWFTVTHLHWWVAVLGTTMLSLVPPLTLACGTFWVLFHTVRQSRRPGPDLSAWAGRRWLRPLRSWVAHRLTLGRTFLADPPPGPPRNGSGEQR
ncbi:hypothetical protein [Nakamurella multipartita]|uniref:Uncharacterized protein n=1 Tax=Nakamurella multipartita (strain ATCC 700099 / DSM 44233 / CIP 104796 / JCM 9543 / NBRC 105858 / Y-104) TaxID=479431 RepID=C8X8L3_NAKMY|nr:hypothetical protein [Nakamurella multipartita]ACV79068.1 hypothetical protein Namu_2722 [Nakamurella multipartita DSM 44233]